MFPGKIVQLHSAELPLFLFLKVIQFSDVSQVFRFHLSLVFYHSYLAGSTGEGGTLARKDFILAS